MKKKILLVEDEAIIAISEAQMLQKHGFEVITAYKGERALELVDEVADISLILMDIDLGRGIDGTEAAQKILEKKDLPVVFLSSHTEPEIVEKTEGITSYGYIVKNSGETVMLASIRMAFRLYSAHMELKSQKEELWESEEKFRTLMEQSIDMLFLHDLDGNIIDVNSRGEYLTGYSRSELLSMTIPDLDPDYYQREDSGAFWKKINYNEPFQFQARLIRKDGSIFWIDVVLAKVKINGRTLIMTLSRDITERLNLYEALKKSEEKYRMLYENAPMSYQSLDENGCFLEVNPAWLETLGGYAKEEVIGKSFSEFIHPDSLHDFKKNLAAFKKTGKAENNVYKMRTKNGEYIDASFKGCIAFSETGQFLRTHCVFEDMTQLKAAEESVRSHAERLELTMKSARVAWWEMDVSTGKVDFSQQKTDMLGYSPGDFQHYEDFTALLHPDDYEEAMSAMRSHLEGKADRYDVEYRILTSSGEYRWFHDLGSIVNHDSHGTPLRVAGIVIDVTRQKENELLLEKAKLSLETILNSIPEDIYLVDIDSYEVLFMNTQMKQSFPDARVGDICYEVFRGSSEPCVHCTNDDLFDQDGNPANTVVWECRNPVNGNWYINYDRAIQWLNGKYVRLQIAADITQRKEMELALQKQKEELLETLQQKDYLMQELNHRVKNNLNMVNSLIALKDAEINESLSDIQNQINAISLVHQKLQKVENANQIDIEAYLYDLLNAVFSSFSDKNIEIQIETDQKFLETNRMIQLGLLINEIATNAVKHGFDDEAPPRFSVKLSNAENQQCVLQISNTGSAFPETIDIDNPETLGMQLIVSLVAQLNGTVELQKVPNPVYTIRFPFS